MPRLLVLAALAACQVAPRPRVPVITTAERSRWERTGRYDEAIALCHAFADDYPGVWCDEIGRTLEDRPIVAVRIARAPRGAPAIYVQAGIHAGEIEGKDAGFWLLRDLLDGKVARGALDVVDVIFVPCINPDGHERFGPNNRPNQRGPAEMGFRTDAARLNINRDFVKADAPETRAILGVLRRFDPAVFVDIHTTDGAKFQHDVSLTIAPRAPRADRLDQVAQALSSALVERLTALGHLPVTFYPSLLKDDDPTSGFAVGEAPPRFSQAYAAARSRIGILVENHSWRTYRERVQSSYDVLEALLERAARDAPTWLAAEQAATRADLALLGGQLPLVYDNTPHTIELEFRGYAYERKPSEISGALRIVYDEHTPRIWKVPLRDELVVKVSTKVPEEGYIVDGGYAPQVAAVLERHGIAYSRIEGQPRIAVEAFRASKVTVQPPFEGRARMQLDGAWATETRTLDRGAIFVSVRQPLARLIVHLLDPAGPDSLAQWGELATAFERKEYLESYVAEDIARAMLDQDPALRARFEAALAADPELAKSPDKRLDWFYQRSPMWDERTNLLPIYRTAIDFRPLSP
jgi:hypothetical protein